MNPTLPESFGNLRSVEKLVLFGAQDPRAVGDSDPLPRERHQFPKTMSQLKSLRYLDLGRNGFEEVSDFVKDLPKLTELGLGWNDLKDVPPILTNLRNLQTLNLEANDLDDLSIRPASSTICACSSSARALHLRVLFIPLDSRTRL